MPLVTPTLIKIPQSDPFGQNITRAVVEIKKKWTDTAWTIVPYLYVDWLTHSVGSETFDRAQLRWRYGRGMQAETAFSADWERLWDQLGFPDENYLLGMYVRITVGDYPNRVRWYGTIEEVDDIIDGTSISADFPISQGEQQLMCYGFDYQLDQVRMLSSIAIDEGGQVVTISRGVTFNNEGRWNRTSSQTNLPDPFVNSFAFSFDDEIGGDNQLPWSTANIVEYLVAQQFPKDANNQNIFKWHAQGIELLPFYDSPEVFSHGRKMTDLLNSLVSRERFLAWHVEVVEVDTDAGGVEEQCRIIFSTFAREDIDIDANEGHYIYANPRQFIVDFRTSPSTENPVRRVSALDEVDQVVVQGARRTSTFTISGNPDGTLEKGWTSAEENLYNNGAIGWPDYTAGELMLNEQLHVEARSSEILRDVFVSFSLPNNWDGLAGDGEGGEKNPVFPGDVEGDPNTGIQQYWKEVYFLQQLPLQVGRDYSSDRIQTGAFLSHDQRPFEKLRPFALVELPELRASSPAEKRWVLSDNLGKVSELPYLGGRAWDREFSCRVRVMPQSAKIQLDVSGSGQQHVIASNEFVPNVDDILIPQAEFDWSEWIFTVAVMDDRHAEAKYPSDQELKLAGVENVRRMLIPAGDAYRIDYVVPNTVVGIDQATGRLEKTLGGYVNDDRELLNRVAKLAWQWYQIPRVAVQWRYTHQNLNHFLKPGDLVTEIGGGNDRQIVNSLVTERKLSWYVGEHQETPPVTYSISTGFAELDPQIAVALGRPMRQQ